MEQDFKTLMAQAKKDAEKGGGTFKELECGSYVCRLTKAFVNKSKAGKLQVNIDMEVIQGECIGATHRVFRSLEHSVARSILFSEMSKMELDLSVCETPEELETMLTSLTDSGPVVSIIIFESKGYRNTKIEEFLGYEDTPTPPAPTPAPTPEPEPVPQEDGFEIKIGAKVKYTYNGVEKVGTVFAIHEATETVDFAFAKGVKLEDIIGPA